MTEFWKMALSLTGVSAVGSFVVFSLYKDWLHLPALNKLSGERLYRLFLVFLVLTFLFGVATLGLAAQKAHLDNSTRERSAAELSKIMADRHEAGERILAKAEADTSLSPSQTAKVKEVHQEYSDRMKKVQDAVKSGDEVRAAEQYKGLLRVVQSTNTSQALPAAVQKDLADNGCGGDHFLGRLASKSSGVCR
jgi:hypothetical protein